MEKTLVLWDVGAVLLELKYAKVYLEGAGISGRTVEEYKQLANQLEIDVLNGDCTYEDHQRRIREILRKPDMTRAELEAFVINTWGGEITHVVDLKQRVYFKGNCPVNIFSNIDRFGFEILSRKYPRMMQTFRPDSMPICSYSSRGTKPKSPKMYKDGARSAVILGCDRVILIDDKKSVLKRGIEEFGWYGIHFTPYIDPNEAIRLHSASEASFSSDKLFVANSVKELEQTIKDLGIKLSVFV